MAVRYGDLCSPWRPRVLAILARRYLRSTTVAQTLPFVATAYMVLSQQPLEEAIAVE